MAFPIDDPNDDEVEALLSVERRRPDVPPETIAAIRAGASARIAALGLGSGGSNGPSGSSGTSASNGSGSAPSGGSAPPAVPTLPSSSLAPWVLRLAIFTAGATSGWVAHEVVDHAREHGAHRPSSSLVDPGTKPRRDDAPEPRSAASHEPPPGPRSFSAPPGVVAPPRTVPGPTRGPAPAPRTSPVAAATTSDVADVASVADLTEEQRLLESARRALLRGDPSSALATLDEHRLRFPSGRLAEERQALAVRALARAGREDAARVSAEAFRRAYPRSLLLPVVDRASPPHPAGEISPSLPSGSSAAPVE